MRRRPLIFLDLFRYIVFNCATQNNYLPRGTRHANYDAIRVAMTKLEKFARENGMSVAIPKIGAGLAGGDWKIIGPILDEVFSDYDVTVYEP